MTSHLFQLPLRMLALGALCTAPLITMANGLVGAERSDSVVHSSDAWSSRAAPAGWAGERFATYRADSAHPMSFAYAARERSHGQPAAGAMVSRDDSVARPGAWAANFQSDSHAPGAFASVTTPVPEPGTYALMVAGLAVVGFVLRRRRPS